MEVERRALLCFSFGALFCVLLACFAVPAARQALAAIKNPGAKARHS